ncbi:lysylphosphatidylglycerol synthase transmembrane domain-containing protein [Marinobacter nanhaiticus D15-8W]|uniref:UPF0104 family protein n=1 Tax=Marinobacter nanhaiticus D15-8W TaxID=626887 RepID=N6W2J2_9GAMM|nr:lysylphosphatidylglycerol synthase transmembrane domain-containing protein [Marinobacter nanhaiticus]ENO14334.1 UPF0104 family protein [Marinobacter nanhaiticus D15-8W]BES71722.1 lysylphosphatidylglycerol synthase transmembrane domain-containing protein [Marinobacter nanhaiticus D15-8W]
MSRYLPYLRWIWTLTILTGALVVFGQADIVSHLEGLSLTAVALALGLFTLQLFMSAWRWSFTARQLGLAIDWRDALREYYLATFVNQVLPGGVLGDANRALRHGAMTRQRSRAVHAVMIERLSGQVVLVILAVTAWAFLLSDRDGVALSAGAGGVHVGLVAAGMVFVAILAATFFRARVGPLIAAFRDALWVALLQPKVLGVQMLSSALVVGSYVMVFLVLAWGMDVSMPQSILVPCVLCLLMTMVIPVTVAGWGIREGVAGALWVWAGYPAGEGLALSIAYGALFLISSLPGLPFVLPRACVRAFAKSGRP